MGWCERGNFAHCCSRLYLLPIQCEPMCSGSEAGSYLRLIAFVYLSQVRAEEVQLACKNAMPVHLSIP